MNHRDNKSHPFLPSSFIPLIMDFPSNVSESATSLLNYVQQLRLCDDDKELLLRTVYVELRIRYLSEGTVSGYEHLKGVEPDLDSLTNDLWKSIDSLYERKDDLDLEELIAHIGTLWSIQ